jgi:DNA-binding response OmpR family regulator
MGDGPDGRTTVVVVEDDDHIADLVGLYLRQSGYRVTRARDGASGIAAIEREPPALVVLDVGLPGAIDGFEVCRRLRGAGNVPVLMLTARDSEMDRVVGLELGADDYVTKPFSPRELVARVRAILRRADAARGAGVDSPPAVHAGDVVVDPKRREVLVAGDAVDLTAREFDLLHHLARHRGLVLSRRQLLDAVWGATWVGDDRTVDVHVAQIRKKCGPGLPLRTVWGVGYRMD